MIKMKKAFTIVELLVVMAVIGILITLAVVGIQAIQRSQRETTRLNDIRNLDAKLAEYYTKYRHYPVTDMSDTSETGNTDIVFDIQAPDVGVCLFIPEKGANHECDVMETNNSTKFSNIILSNGLFGSVTGLSSFRYVDFGGVYTGYTCPSLNTTADSFEIDYVTRMTNTPQEYLLFGCLESGITQNFGTLDNANN